MPPRPDRLVLVVGVGRSGTSLAMQALARLGAAISEDLVPASRTNPRGAFEDMGVRDRMNALGHALGHFRGGLRPEAWRDEPLTAETERWLTGHLEALAARAAAPVLAIKFPLASVYLPIWAAAATHAGLALQPVWATRGAAANLGSFTGNFGFAPETARRRYLLRMGQLLADAPPETFLLPYEGWTAAPGDQIRALAEAAGLPEDGAEAALEDLFDPSIDHSTAAPQDDAPAEPGLDPLVRELDAMLRGRRGRTGRLFGADLAPLRALGRRILANLAGPEPQPAAVTGGHAGLEAAYADLTRARDADLAARADLVADHETELSRLRVASQRHATARKRAVAAAQTQARRFATRREAWMLRATHAEAQAQAAEAKVKAVQATARAMEAKAQAAKAQAQAMAAQTRAAEAKADRQAALRHSEAAAAAAVRAQLRASARWRAGDMVVGAFARPRWRSLTLPWRLLRLGWRTRRGG